MRHQLSWFRGYFCPDGTKDSLCAVPILGGQYDDEEAWCQAEFNATGCAEIRDEAQNQMVSFCFGVCLKIIRPMLSVSCRVSEVQ